MRCNTFWITGTSSRGTNLSFFSWFIQQINGFSKPISQSDAEGEEEILDVGPALFSIPQVKSKRNSNSQAFTNLLTKYPIKIIYYCNSIYQTITLLSYLALNVYSEVKYVERTMKHPWSISLKALGLEAKGLLLIKYCRLHKIPSWMFWKQYMIHFEELKRTNK